jgi:hypothetical protein
MAVLRPILAEPEYILRDVISTPKRIHLFCPRLQKTTWNLNFSEVCPEPVVVNRSFLV